MGTGQATISYTNQTRNHVSYSQRTMDLKKVVLSLEKKLKEPRYGQEAQEKMMPVPRPGYKPVWEAESSCRKAGVLVLLYPKDGRFFLVLTRRSDRVVIHQAQISFPGGHREPGESYEQTALREAREELGIDPESVRVIGELSPLYIPPTNYCIYPVIAASAQRPDFHPSELEVAEIIEVPLDHLMDSRNIRREEWTVRGITADVPFFQYNEHKIWGATAMVLSELKELLSDAIPGS